MKKRYLVFGIMAFSHCVKAQSIKDTAFEKKKLSKTTIDFAFSYYNQDGNNSAVTGGIGTEKLSVYATDITISHQFKKLNTFSFNTGLDIITSASTDKIDYRVSSASYQDQHFHADVSFQRQLKKTDLKISGSLGMAFESDYAAIPLGISFNYTEPSKMRTYQLGFSCSIDDLRWGRFDNEHSGDKLQLVYPSELRYKDWFDVKKRNTYNIKAGFTQVLSKKITVGIFPEFIYQKGLLATPFHRVYFNNNSLRVENLPKQRFKFPVALKLNAFLGSRFILKNQYSFYADNFGIIANAIETEGALKIVPQFTMAAFFRFYHQSGSDYFKPYKEHQTEEEFYTSDYDLSRYNTYKAGLSLKIFPISKKQKKAFFENILVRYAFYYRSNHLQAHIMSFALSVASEKNR